MSRGARISPGMMREVLTVQNGVRTATTGGSGTTVWTAEATKLRGYVRSMKGKEYLEARQAVGATPYEVTVPGPLPSGLTITSKSRFVWASNTGTRTLILTSPLRPSADGSRFTVLCAETE